MPLKRISIIVALCALPSAVLASPAPLPGFHGKAKPSKGLLPLRWLPKGDSKAPTSNNTLAQAKVPAASQPKAGKRKVSGKASPSLVPVGGACVEDEQCVEGSWCSDSTKRCRKLLTPINAMYLFYLSGDRRFMEVLGLFWRKKGSSGYNVLFPFYWHFYDTPKQTTARVFFPLYWNFEDRKAQTRSVWVPPFQYRRAPGERNYRLWPLVFWSDYGKEGAGLTVLPLFHRSRRGTHSSTIAPLLLTGYASDPAKHYSRGLIAGLYYWHREGKEGTDAYKRADAFFPFFYTSSGKDERFTWVLPFNFYSRRGKRRSLWLLPLLYHTSKPESARTISLVPPFYYRRLGGNTRLFSPLFLYEKDRDAKVKHWGLVVPPYYHRRDDEREVDSLLPLFWRWRNTVEKTTTWVAGPFVARSDEEGGTQVLFPIFWRFSDRRSGSSTSLLFPLAYRHKRPDGSHFNMLFPFYLGLGKKHWSAGILPLLYLGSGEKRRHAVLFPLFWHIAKGDTSTTVLANLYYRSEPKGWMAGLAPLFFAGRRGGDSHQVLFPLFWHLRSEGEGYDTWVGGPFFHHRSRAHGRLTGLLPLFVNGNWKGQSLTVAPLFYHRSDNKRRDSVTVAGPYWRYRKARESGHHLLPLAFYRRGWDKKGLTTKVQGGLLPLFYYERRKERTLLVTPLGGYRRLAKDNTSQGLLGPVFWHDSDRSKAFAVAPLFLRHTDKEAKATTTLGLPFYVHYASPKQSSLVLFPIYWRFEYQNERNLVIFPFWWQTRERKKNFGADVLFPLYWRIFDNANTTTVAGPAFWYSRDKGKRGGFGLVPLALYQKKERSSWAFALPFFWYDHDFDAQRRTYVAGPAYYRSYGKALPPASSEKDKKGKTGQEPLVDEHDGKGYAAGLLPIYYHKRTEARRYTVLFPLVWYFARPKKQESLLIAGPYFSHSSAKRRGLGLFPLFYRAINRDGQRELGVFPLFYRIKSPLRSALFTPLFGYDRDPERRHLYVGPYIQTRRGKVDRDIIVPLFYRSYDTVAKSTTVFSLPGYYGSWRKGKSAHVAFPLFWRFTGVDWAHTVLFPFVWDFNDRHARRTTVIAPLFARDRDSIAKSVSWYTLPGIWVRSRPGATDTVVFPLFWHFGGDKRSSTVAFPLYWDFKRKNKRSTVVFPLFWRFDRPDTRTYLVANTYYQRNKRKETYDFWFFPLVRVQRPRAGDLNLEFLLGMFGYQRIGRNRLLKLLFIPIKLKPSSGTPVQAAPPAKGGPKRGAPRPKAKPRPATPI